MKIGSGCLVWVGSVQKMCKVGILLKPEPLSTLVGDLEEWPFGFENGCDPPLSHRKALDFPPGQAPDLAVGR